MKRIEAAEVDARIRSLREHVDQMGREAVHISGLCPGCPDCYRATARRHGSSAAETIERAKEAISTLRAFKDAGLVKEQVSFAFRPYFDPGPSFLSPSSFLGRLSEPEPPEPSSFLHFTGFLLRRLAASFGIPPVAILPRGGHA